MSLPSRYDARHAGDAFEVHQALMFAERALPSLRRNPRWTLLRMDAFEAFCAEFGKRS